MQHTNKSPSCDYLLFVIINKIEKITDSLFPAVLLKEHHNLLKNIEISEIQRKIIDKTPKLGIFMIDFYSEIILNYTLCIVVVRFFTTE